MADIEIKRAELSNLVTKLEKNNLDISNSLTKINSYIKSLDESVWNSPEKRKIDEKMLPFIEKVDNTVFNNLKLYTDKLTFAIDKYYESEMSIKKDVEDTSNSNNIEIL